MFIQKYIIKDLWSILFEYLTDNIWNSCYDKETLELLLVHCICPNVKTKGGVTMLMLASSGGYIESVKLLLKYGAKVNSKNDCYFTALMYSSIHNHVECTKLLIKNGANLNVRTISGATAFLIASQYDSVDVLDCLYVNGVNININVTDNKGYTALMIATKNKSYKCMRKLLKYGVNSCMMSVNCETAQSIADESPDYKTNLILMTYHLDEIDTPVYELADCSVILPIMNLGYIGTIVSAIPDRLINILNCYDDKETYTKKSSSVQFPKNKLTHNRRKHKLKFHYQNKRSQKYHTKRTFRRRGNQRFRSKRNFQKVTHNRSR